MLKSMFPPFMDAPLINTVLKGEGAGRSFVEFVLHESNTNNDSRIKIDDFIVMKVYLQANDPAHKGLRYLQRLLM